MYIYCVVCYRVMAALYVCCAVMSLHSVTLLTTVRTNEQLFLLRSFLVVLITNPREFIDVPNITKEELMELKGHQLLKLIQDFSDQMPQHRNFHSLIMNVQLLHM